DDVAEPPERTQREHGGAPYDEIRAEHAGGETSDDIFRGSAGGERYRGFIGSGDEAPELVGNVAIGDVAEETEDVAGADAAEEVADQVADGSTPCGGRA